MSTATKGLSAIETRTVGALISFGYGTGSDFGPFDLESLEYDLNGAEMRALQRLISRGLIERGKPDGPLFTYTSIHGYRFSTDGAYRLTQRAIDAYHDGLVRWQR